MVDGKKHKEKGKNELVGRQKGRPRLELRARPGPRK